MLYNCGSSRRQMDVLYVLVNSQNALSRRVDMRKLD